MIGVQQAPSSNALFPPNTPNKNFEVAILFKDHKNILRLTQPPGGGSCNVGTQGGSCKLCPGGKCRWLKSKVLAPFLKINYNRTVSNSSTPFFLNDSDQNFELAILFKIVKMSNSYVSGLRSPQPWGKGM